MTDRELMQQALMALEEGMTSKEWRELVKALRERLARPEQEPVECMCGICKLNERQWQGLTDEEIVHVIHPLTMADMADEATDYEIARAIEAKLKEKNG